MKNELQESYPERMGYPALRIAVRETWLTLNLTDLNDLLDSMPARMQAVIDANGMHTKY